MTADLASLRHHLLARIGSTDTNPARGAVKEVRGITLTVTLHDARVGDVCVMRLPSGEERLGEVIGIDGSDAIVSAFSDLRGISNLTQVIATHQPLSVRVGDHLLGQVLDAFGQGGAGRPPRDAAQHCIFSAPPPPMERRLISERFDTGIAVIDTMLTVGRGQRMGIFGGAGLGKSTLVSMLVNNSAFDVGVIGLVGERGREVRELWEQGIEPERRGRCVLVASTSDRPAVERRLAALTAMTVAEGFADRGLNVLLVIDSLTRFARAQREIGLAAGEPPSRRGFPPSTAGVLAELVERAGPRRKGMITAFFTVLVEGELDDDPVAEELKALLDGHVVLSRKLSEAGTYPAIDVLSSRSRLQSQVASRSERQISDRIRELMARHRDIELLLQIGEYRTGADPLADEAIARHDQILATFRQGHHDYVAPNDAFKALAAITGLS